MCIRDRQYGVLYLPVRKRGDDSGLITIVSTQTYAANLNCIMEELGYPVPVKEADEPKKAVPLAPSERASNERGSISTASMCIRDRSWADAYWNALTRVPEDNVYHCGFVRAKAYSFLSDDDNEQMRRLGKLREGEYGFYMNGYFVDVYKRQL